MKTKSSNSGWSNVYRMLVSLIFLFIQDKVFAQTITTTLSNDQTANAIVFNFENNSSSGVSITEIGACAATSGLQTVQLWAKEVPAGAPGSPGPVSSATGWTFIKSATVNTIANTTGSGNTASMVVNNFCYKVLSNKEVRFCLFMSGGLRYSNIGLQTCTFSQSPYPFQINSCVNYGYSGDLSSPNIPASGFVGYVGFATISATVCNSLPNPGNTLTSSSSVCNGTNVQLALENLGCNNANTYSWQSADDASFSTNVQSIGSTPLLSVMQNGKKYYRCLVTCTSTLQSAFSNTAFVDETSFLDCYCTPQANCTFPDIITQVSLANVNRSSVCDNPVTGYSYFNSPPNVVELTAGMSYPLTVSTGGDVEGAAVWIDYNHNAQFEASELVLQGFQGTNPATYNATLTVPLYAATCLTRMRVRGVYQSNPALSTGPCGDALFGETEDYLVNITAPQTEQINAVCKYTWPCTGIEYQNSGVYTCTYIDNGGCTQTRTLQLTLLPCPCPCDSSTMTNTLIVNTAYDEATGNSIPANPIGHHDPNWILVSAPSTLYTDPLPAQPFVTAYCLNSGNTFFPNSNWISPYQTSASFQNNPGVPYTFQYEFCLCDNDSVTFDLRAMQDDSIVIYLDNHTYTFNRGGFLGNYNAYNYGITTLYLGKGRHTLNVDLYNLGLNCLGFDLSGSISADHLVKHGYCDQSFVIADAGSDQTICEGDCATLVSNLNIAGATYYWHKINPYVPAGTGNLLTVCPTVTTCYELSIIRPDSCVLKDTVCVFVTPAVIYITDTTICDAYTWSCNGMTYVASGIYDCFIPPCTIFRLNLTIIPSQLIAISALACDSFTWYVNGMLYTSSGVYTYSIPGTPCITYELNLQIRHAGFYTSYKSFCGCAYLWNGQILTESGSYTGTFTDMYGCDSIVTLILTLHDGSPPCVDTNILQINTGIDPTGAFIVAGQADARWTILDVAHIPGAANGPATVTSFSGWINGTNSRAISAMHPPTYITLDETPGFYGITFRRTFKTCEDDTLTFNWQMMYDNWLNGIWIDGQFVAGSIETSNSNPNNYQSFHPVSFTKFLMKGEHQLDIRVINFCPPNGSLDNPHGLELFGTIQGTISSLVANTSPANCCCSPENSPNICGHTDSLVVSTGISAINGSTISDSQLDDKWTVLAPGSTTFVSAVGVSLTGTWAENPQCHAISGGNAAGMYTFRRMFKLCQADTIDVDLTMIYDNWLNGIYIDGNLVTNPITITPVADRTNMSNFTMFHHYAFSISLVSGYHTLDVKVGNNEGPTGLGIYGWMKGHRSSLVTNASPDSCDCECNADFELATEYCKSSTVHLSSASTGNGYLNKWEVIVAEGDCSLNLPVIYSTTGDVVDLALSSSLYHEGQCYKIKHTVYTANGICCDSSKCFCIVPLFDIDTICAPPPYVWHNTSYGSSGIYTYTYLAANNCVVTRKLVLTISNVAAIYFDGIDDFISVPDNAANNLGKQNFTIEIWFRIDPVQPSGIASILEKRTTLSNGYKIFTMNGQLYVKIAGSLYGPYGSNLYDSICHHFALVKNNGRDYSVYIDNVLVGSFKNKSNLGNPGPLFFGAPLVPEWRCCTNLKGALDEFRIWSVPRSLAQLIANSACDISAQANLTAYYRFNDGVPDGNNTTMTQVVDDSWLQHPGDLNNFALNGNVSNFVNGCVPCCQVYYPVITDHPWLVCGPFTWHGQVYTLSGIYVYPPNDTLNLQIIAPSYSSSSVSFTNAYTWLANGATYTSSGVYTTTIQNAAGCDSIMTLNLSITPGAFNLSLSEEQTVSCFGQNDGMIHAVATPAGLYSYQITYPDQSTLVNQSGIFNQLQPGFYTVCASQLFSPFASVCGMIEVHEPDPLIVLMLDSIPSCGNAGAAINAVIVGGTTNLQPYLTYWTDGMNNLLNPYPDNHKTSLSGLMAGTYHLLVEDDHQCSASNSAVIPNIPLFTVTANAGYYDCNSGMMSIDISSIGGSGSITYEINGQPWTPNLAYYPVGSYLVIATDANGCSATSNVTLVPPLPLTVAASVSHVHCYGGSDGMVQITASGGTAPYTGVGTLFGLGAGVYSYMVTDANGCQEMLFLSITQPAVLNATTTVTDATCNSIPNGSVQVSAAGGTAPYSGVGTYPGLSAGNYQYNVIDANGCNTITTAIVGTAAMPSISLDAGTGTICNGDSITIIASSINDPNYNYTWLPQTGLNTYNGSAVLANPLTTTSYTVTGTDMNGCTNTSSIVLMVNTCNPSVLELTCFHEGYWNTMGGMVPVLSNQGQPSTWDGCDSIDVELHEANYPYQLIIRKRFVMKTDGTTHCEFNTGNTTTPYYIAVQHRNAIYTWSAVPVLIGPTPVSYNFTTAASQAYGNNQVEVSPGIWAFHVGDVNQDENIDLIDLGSLYYDIDNFNSGYLATDINGDGNVDLLDAPIPDNNINEFIYSVHP